jgi:hypothetical protein
MSVTTVTTVDNVVQISLSDVGVQGATGATGAAGTNGTNGVGYADVTSTSSVPVSVGLHTWTVANVGAFVAGMRIRAIHTDTPSIWLEGFANVASGTTIIITADKVSGSGTHNTWKFAVAGEIGATGSTGATGAAGTNGQGVPVGGTANQVLAKIDGTDYNTNWVTLSVADGTTSTAANGFGFMGIPQNATTTGSYTIVAGDAGKHVYASATRTITIPANSALALPVGTTLTFIAGSGATMTIAITTDTMYLAGPGTTGSRTLAPFGIATAVKLTSTTWIISGNGLT